MWRLGAVVPREVAPSKNNQPNSEAKWRELMQMRIAANKARMISAEQAAVLVRPDMWIDYGGAVCQPDVFDKALAARKDELRNVKIRSTLIWLARHLREQNRRLSTRLETFSPVEMKKTFQSTSMGALGLKSSQRESTRSLESPSASSHRNIHWSSSSSKRFHQHKPLQLMPTKWRQRVKAKSTEPLKTD